MTTPCTLRLPPQIFNPSLYGRLRALWFAGVAADCAVAPHAATARWFGFGPPEQKALLDSQCRDQFIAALAAVGPAAFPLPVPTTCAKTKGRAEPSWAEERSMDAQIAAPFYAPEVWMPGSTATEDDVKWKANDTEGAAAHDALGLILLLDQVPRNVFRGDEQAVVYAHYDRISRAVARTLLEDGGKDHDARHPVRPDLHPSIRTFPVRRTWFYMPLMHSEHLEDHARYVELVESLKGDVAASEDAVKEAEFHLGFARKHAVILEQFGRFPHRNEVLGREATKKEQTWIEEGGETFGTKKSDK